MQLYTSQTSGSIYIYIPIRDYYLWGHRSCHEILNVRPIFYIKRDGGTVEVDKGCKETLFLSSSSPSLPPLPLKCFSGDQRRAEHSRKSSSYQELPCTRVNWLDEASAKSETRGGEIAAKAEPSPGNSGGRSFHRYRQRQNMHN